MHSKNKICLYDNIYPAKVDTLSVFICSLNFDITLGLIYVTKRKFFYGILYILLKKMVLAFLLPPKNVHESEQNITLSEFLGA